MAINKRRASTKSKAVRKTAKPKTSAAAKRKVAKKTAAKPKTSAAAKRKGHKENRCQTQNLRSR